MEPYEVSAILDLMYLKNKESWEQTKMQGYITAQVNSTKKISPDDIMKFPWEKGDVNVDTEEDLKAMEEEMKRYKDRLNGGNNL